MVSKSKAKSKLTGRAAKIGRKAAAGSRERIRAHAAAIARSAVSFEDVKECRALLHGKPLDVVRDEVLATWCGFVPCSR